MSTLNMLFGKSGIKRFAVRVVCRLHKKLQLHFHKLAFRIIAVLPEVCNVRSAVAIAVLPENVLQFIS